MGRGNFERERAVPFKSIATVCGYQCKTAEPIEMPFGLWAWMGSRNRMLDGGPMCDVVLKKFTSLSHSHLLMSSCYCRQTAVCIKMPLGMEIRLRPGDFVLDGNPDSPIFVQCPLWPNDWMDEDATWYGSRPRPRPHCIRRGPSSARKGHNSPRLFGACLLWPWSPISATVSSCYIKCAVCPPNCCWTTPSSRRRHLARHCSVALPA